MKKLVSLLNKKITLIAVALILTAIFTLTVFTKRLLWLNLNNKVSHLTTSVETNSQNFSTKSEFVGTWYWNDPKYSETENGSGEKTYQSANFVIILEVNKSQIKGYYNSEMNNGNRIAICDKDTHPKQDCINGIIKGNLAQITFLNGYEDSPPGHATLTYNPMNDTISWITEKLPPANFYVPTTAVLHRKF